MINEREFYRVVVKDAALESAWLAANVAYYEAATTRGGIRGSWARLWRRLAFEASVSNLLQEYDRATGVRHRTSDLNSLRTMVAKDVMDHDRTRLVGRLELILQTPSQ
jgi:hypothetical protein